MNKKILVFVFSFLVILTAFIVIQRKSPAYACDCCSGVACGTCKCTDPDGTVQTNDCGACPGKNQGCCGCKKAWSSDGASCSVADTSCTADCGGGGGGGTGGTAPTGPTPPSGLHYAPNYPTCTVTSCNGNPGNCTSGCPAGYTWCYGGYCVGSGVVAGNPTPAPTSAPLGPGTYDDVNPHFRYSGTWTKVNDANATQGHYHRSITANSIGSVDVIGVKTFTIGTIFGPNKGKAQIFVDNTKIADVDGYQAAAAYNSAFGPYSLADTNKHTLKIKVTGQKNAASTGLIVVVDGLTLSAEAAATPTPSQGPTATPAPTATLIPTPSAQPTITPNADAAKLKFKVKMPDITATTLDLENTRVEVYDGAALVTWNDAAMTKNGDYFVTTAEVPLNITENKAYNIAVKGSITVRRIFQGVTLTKSQSLDCTAASTACGELSTAVDQKPLVSGDSDGFNTVSGSYNKIDSADLTLVGLYFNRGNIPQADFNMDGTVDIKDLEIIGKNYGMNGD